MKRLFIIVLITVPLLFMSSCELFDAIFGTGEEETGEPTMEEEQRDGTLQIVDGSTIQTDQMEVVTFADKSDIDADGNFSVDAPQADKYQLLLFRSKSGQKPVYVGMYDPNRGTVTANDTTTALALTMMNPYLVYTTQSQRHDYLMAVKQNQKFYQLLTHLNNAYTNDATMALDYETNPTIFQLVAQIIKETMLALSQGGQNPADREAPYIEDATGDDITFVNPRHVWYAAGVHPDEGSLDEVVTINRKQTLLSFNWGWPPVVLTDPQETTYGLGDGYFKLHLAKGIDFDKIDQWDDPIGRATILNTAQSVLYIAEMAIGYMPLPDMDQITNHITISNDAALALGRNIAERNAEGFIVDFCHLIESNSEELAYWIWQETHENAADYYLSTFAGIIKNVTFVFKLMGLVNEHGPFFWDLVTAPGEVTYYVTQQGGTIASMDQNNAPEAEFDISPPAGIIGTEFTFNAAYSSDDLDALGDLQFRWDWESDGYFDTAWDNAHAATHSYDESGSYTVTLEVKDSYGLVGNRTHVVNVGGGAGTATHVKLFRDNLPWSSNAMETMLEELGFTTGAGSYQYEIITSDLMPTVELIPGQDLVIISNDQNQTFYNNYAASQLRFNNFVYMGGSLFWEACDEGWASGSLADAGVVLPGNLTTILDYDYYNYIPNPELPLVAGLPTSLDHNYASHESFDNLPDGTTIYCIDESSNPTLIEFNLGGGWVLITGQPLEHQYDNVYGVDDMSELLPRIVAYFTGQSFAKPLAKRNLRQSVRPTHE